MSMLFKKKLIVLFLLILPFASLFSQSDTSVDLRYWEYINGDIPFPETGFPDENSESMRKIWQKMKYPPVLNTQDSAGVIWMRTRLPDKHFPHPYLFIRYSATLFEVYLDNGKLYSFGSFTRQGKRFTYSKTFGTPLHLIKLPDNYAGKLLYVRIFSNRPKIGLDGEVKLGSKATHVEYLLKSEILLIVIGILFLIIGVGSLVFYLTNIKKTLFLSFSLFNIANAVYTLSFVLIKNYFLPFPVFWSYLFIYSSFLVLAPSLAHFLEKCFGAGYKSIIKRIWQFHLLYAVIFTVLLTIDSYFLAPLVLITSPIVAVEIIMTIIFIIAHAVRGNIQAKVLSLGLVLFLLAGISDLLHSMNVLSGTLYVFTYGMLAFTITQIIVLMKRVNEVNKRLEYYSKELENKSEQLEIKVIERTEELEREKQELQKINRMFELKNKQLEAEMLLARKIQNRLIPDTPPLANIATMYRPMDLIGGDFFDFIDFHERNSLGIFLSDVSGHGVPAALITSMIKGIIHQSGELRKDPAGLLSYMNEHLIDQSAENFVTAFYCIYDLETLEIQYANAGHNAPIIFNSNSAKFVEDADRGTPLAIINTFDQFKIKKHYKNNRLQLSKGDKLLFYTDGLTEAINPGNKSIDFENSGLFPSIKEYSHVSPHSFLQGLYSNLVKFRGGENFDDDICMIVIEGE